MSRLVNLDGKIVNLDNILFADRLEQQAHRTAIVGNGLSEWKIPLSEAGWVRLCETVAEEEARRAKPTGGAAAPTGEGSA